MRENKTVERGAWSFDGCLNQPLTRPNSNRGEILLSTESSVEVVVEVACGVVCCCCVMNDLNNYQRKMCTLYNKKALRVVGP